MYTNRRIEQMLFITYSPHSLLKMAALTVSLYSHESAVMDAHLRQLQLSRQNKRNERVTTVINQTRHTKQGYHI